MREFGSDFHCIDAYQSQRAHLTDVYPGASYYADGRQCLVTLVLQNGWGRIWMPEYFCYEVIESLRQMTGIEIAYYQDFPTNNAQGIVATLPYRDGDVLLRTNYLGIRDFRCEADIPVPVIEDHTHDLMGHWSLYSKADWCIASLRKTLPIPMGGVLWSPKGHDYPTVVRNSQDAEKIASRRWKAMELKAAYLRGEDVKKEDFRKILIDTEDWFDHAEPSMMDERTMDFIRNLDINAWYNAKRRNWQYLCQMVKTKAQVLKPEDESCNMFSFTILAADRDQRDKWRLGLIENNVYPAILWQVPDTAHKVVGAVSNRLLSIHCDGRYSVEDMENMAKLINQVLV